MANWQTWYSVGFSYDEAFIEDFKAAIPSKKRKWDADNKRWLVRADAIATAKELMIERWGVKLHYCLPELEDLIEAVERLQCENAALESEKQGLQQLLRETAARVRLLEHPDFSALHLLPTAPPDVVDAVHRELVKLHHPDRAGGNLERMQAVNAAVDRIRKGGRR